MLNKNSLSVVAGSIALSLLHKKTNKSKKGGSMSQIEILEQIDDANWLIENNRTEFVHQATIASKDLAGFNSIDWSLFPNLERITILGGRTPEQIQKIKIGNLFNRGNIPSKYGLSLTLKGVIVEDPENVLNSAQISVLTLENTPFEFFDWSKINRNGVWSNLVIRDDLRQSQLNYRYQQFVEAVNNIYSFDPLRVVFIPNVVFQTFRYLIHIHSSLPIMLPDTITLYEKRDSWGSVEGLSRIAIDNVANESFPNFANPSTLFQLSLFPSIRFPHTPITGYKLQLFLSKFKNLTSEGEGRWDSGDLLSLLRNWNSKSSHIKSELRKF